MPEQIPSGLLVVDVPARSTDVPTAQQPTTSGSTETLRGSAGRVTINQSPDEAARARHLAKKYQLPVSTAVPGLQELETQDRMEKIDADLSGAPVTRNFMSVPDRAAVAHDVVPDLVSLETGWNSVRAFAEGPFQVVGQSLRGLGSLYDLVGRSLSKPVTDALEAVGATDLRDALTTEIPWYLSPAEILRRPGSDIEELGKEIGPALEDRNFVTDVAGGLGQMSAQIAIAIATGGAGTIATNVTLTATLAGQGVAIQEDILREAGVELGTPEADAALAAGAGITALTEKFGLDVLINRLPAAQRNKITRILIGAGSEGAQEILENVLQNLTALGFTGADVPIADAGTLQEGGVGATVGGIISALIPGQRARNRQQGLDQIGTEAQASALATRDPDALAEHMADSMRATKTGEVSIPGGQLAEWIANQPDSRATLFGLGVEGQIEEAVQLGLDVTIPEDKFARHVLLNPNHTDITPHVRFGPDEMTAAEAEDQAASGFGEELAIIEQQTDLAAQADTGIEADDETNPVTNLAMSEMGLQALFTTADEAGMTPKQFEAYLVKLDRAGAGAAKREAAATLKAEARVLTQEWKSEEQKIKANVEEHFAQSVPAYRTINNIEAVRLDREATQAIVEGLGGTLDMLPTKARGRKIHTTGKEKGLDPAFVAEQEGYDSAEQMLHDILTTPDLDVAVGQEVNRQMNARHGDLRDKRRRVNEARELLLTDDFASVLEDEMNAMRGAQGQGRLKPKVIRQAARARLGQMAIKDLNVAKFLQAATRQGKAAGQALRQGNRPAATQFKTQQVINFHMAKEVTRARERAATQRRTMAKFTRPRKAHRAIPADYLKAIREALDFVSLKPKLGPKAIKNLKAKANADTNPATIMQRLLDEERRINWRNMSVDDFTQLHDNIKELEHKGRTLNKALRADEQRLIDASVADVVNAVATNLLPTTANREVQEQRTTWEKFQQHTRELRMTLFNMDSIMTQLDGQEDLGPAYQAIKGRYDQAISEGYREDQIGWQRRSLKEARAILDLYSGFTRKDRSQLNNKFNIPGVEQRVSRHTIITTLLNLGNAGNTAALIDSKTWTEEEIEAIKDAASEKDWQFAQSVWDYMGSFYPEVAQSEQRRRNFTPERVEAVPIKTQFGTFKGGYYPIRYDQQRSHFQDKGTTDEIINDMRYGNHVSSHTKRGHTEARQQPGKKTMLLDLFVINSHINNLVYDLEAGDALTDIYKVVNNRDTKNAFVQADMAHVHDAIALWTRDVVTGEIGMTHALEAGLRWLRTGFTVAKLGWNVGVGLLQPLGLLQTSVKIGKRNTWNGFRATMTSPWIGKNNVFDFVSQQTGFMATRATNWNKDIVDAQTQVKFHLLDRLAPGNSAQFIRDTMFWGIKTTQRFTDTVTWLGAKRAGMDQFGGDEKKANAFADRMVAQSQASGIFGERTPLERGSFNKNFQQTELVRAFTVLQSYFLAKTNLAINRSRRFKKETADASAGKTAVKFIGLMTDYMLMFTAEALLAGMIRGAWPEEGDDETFVEYAAGETISTVMAGIPGLREVGAVVQGFPSGPVYASVVNDVGKAIGQLSEREIDLQLVKSLNTVGGTLMKYPSSQINKTLSAIVKSSQGEDISAAEFIMGPHFER